MTKRELPEGRKPLTASESADLVKKMHDKLSAGFTAGDRIAQLEELYEAALQDAKEAEAYAAELEANGLANRVAIMRLEAKLAKAMEDLQQLVIEYDEVDLAHDEPPSLTAAVNAARTTLAELKGETDE